MDPARLLADGIPVTLADGSTVNARFDFEAMLRLEKEYGSTHAFMRDMDVRKESSNYFRAVLAGLRASVRDRQINPADLDVAKVFDYRAALIDAWLEAMPAPTAPAESDAEEPDEGKASGEDGIGVPSTPSPRSPSGAPTLSGVA